MIFELVTGDYLFDPKSGDNYTKEEDHLAFITELIGHPDLEWLKEGKRYRKYYTTKGRMKRIHKHKIWKLKEVMKDKYCFKEEEAHQFADFLMQAIQWKNEDRKSAQEMLKHPWLYMPSDYDYRVESEDGSDKEESEEEEQTPAKSNATAEEADDDWVTISSNDSVYNEASDSSEFELIG